MSDNPPVPAPEPGLGSTPAYVPAPPQQVACPNCFTIVSLGTAYCHNCGNAIPPSWPSIPQPIPAPRRSRIGLVIGIVLVILLVGGAAGYLVYNNSQQQILLLAAKNTEQTAANQAPNQIQFTCLSVATDGSHLFHSQYGYSGYATVSETIGLSNPTRFAIDATWTITLDYISLNLVLPSTSSFHLASSSTAHPVFPFTITGSQYNTFPANANFTRFTVTLDATYHVTGTYATYTVPQHSTYDSTTSTGTGALGSNTSPRSC